MRKSPDVLAPTMPDLKADDYGVAVIVAASGLDPQTLLDEAKLKSLGARSGPASLLDVFFVWGHSHSPQISAVLGTY